MCLKIIFKLTQNILKKEQNLFRIILKPVSLNKISQKYVECTKLELKRITKTKHNTKFHTYIYF